MPLVIYLLISLFVFVTLGEEQDVVSKLSLIAFQNLHRPTKTQNTFEIEVKQWSPLLTHDTLTLGPLKSFILLMVIAWNLFMGMLYRMLLFKHIRKKGFLRQPIDFMTGILRFHQDL